MLILVLGTNVIIIIKVNMGFFENPPSKKFCFSLCLTSRILFGLDSSICNVVSVHGLLIK